jgi:hypothetical protein
VGGAPKPAAEVKSAAGEARGPQSGRAQAGRRAPDRRFTPIRKAFVVAIRGLGVSAAGVERSIFGTAAIPIEISAA